MYGWTVQMEINSSRWLVLPSAVDLVTYITRFQWDMAKYPIKQSLKNISEIISKVSQPWHKSRLFCLKWSCLRASVWLQCKQLGTNVAACHRRRSWSHCAPSHIYLFFFYVFFFFFPASNSDRQWSEGQSLGLQQPEGKPAEPGEEECVSHSPLASSVFMCNLRRVTTHCLRLPLGGACWPGVWLTSWRRRTLSWTLSTWLPCWWLCQSKCTSLVMTIRSCSFLLKDDLVSVLTSTQIKNVI